MCKLTPPEEASWTQKQYSVGEAYDICISFFCELWPTFKLEVADVPKVEGMSIYEFFVESLCGSGFDSFGEWNEAIFRVLKIPKREQIGMRLSLQEVFLAVLEFCKLHNERFTEKIDLLVNVVEGMLVDPEDRLFEWTIWRRTIEIVMSFELHSFDWGSEFNDNEFPAK